MLTCAAHQDDKRHLILWARATMLRCVAHHYKRQSSGPVQQCWGVLLTKITKDNPLGQCNNGEVCYSPRLQKAILWASATMVRCVAHQDYKRQSSGPVQQCWGVLLTKIYKRQSMLRSVAHKDDLHHRMSNLRDRIQQTRVHLHHHLCQFSQSGHAGLPHPENGEHIY